LMYIPPHMQMPGLCGHIRKEVEVIGQRNV